MVGGAGGRNGAGWRLAGADGYGPRVMERRYAIYYAPPADSALARFAATWLGRCPEEYPIGTRPEIAGISDARIAELVAEPARYGFHGTLKPPFRLASGHGEGALLDATAAMARDLAPFALPPLRLTTIGGFIALVPSAFSDALHGLADACVTRLDRFRAPATEAELSRRRSARLSARQEMLLARWGYPYVLDELQFHLTLTGRLEAPARALALAALYPLVEPFCREPIPVADIALFVEPAPGAPLSIEVRFPLGSPAPRHPVRQARDAARPSS